MIPRWLHRMWALTNGYFWLPCCLCGRPFGGHERALLERVGKSAETPTRAALVVCPRCTPIVRACRILKALELTGCVDGLWPWPVPEHAKPLFDIDVPTGEP